MEVTRAMSSSVFRGYGNSGGPTTRENGRGSEVYLASEVLGLSLCAVPFNPDVGQFRSEAETEQSTEVPRLHKAVLVRSSGSGAGNRTEGARDAVRGKDEIFRMLYS